MKGKNFWEKEYKKPRHLALSDDPAEDLSKFVKWTKRNAEWDPFPKGASVLDIGCGNGRNILALSEEFKMDGIGLDIAASAIEQAKAKAKEKKLPIEFRVLEIEGALPLPDQSVDIVLDMMTSHFLSKEGRTLLASEIARVLKPYGWCFFKTFILDGDSHAKRLLRDNKGSEEGNYLHPKIGVEEHVYTDEEIYDLFSSKFKIHKMLKSYRHVLDGKPHKRRTVSVYMERLRE